MKKTLLTSLLVLLALVTIGSPAYAADTIVSVKPTATATSTTKEDVPESQQAQDTEVDAKVAEEKIGGIWETVKSFFVNIYNKIDAWREDQLTTWKAIRGEKEQKITEDNEQFEQDKAERVDQVLEGEQASLYTGASKDFNADLFILKIYVFALSVFVIIFSSKVVFYAIIGVIIFSLLNWIVGKVRGPRHI